MYGRTVALWSAVALLGLLWAGCGSSIEGGVAGEPASIETLVSANTVALGDRFNVGCRILDGRGDVVEGEWDFRVTPTSAEIDGFSVTPNETGDVLVTCFAEALDLEDQTPERVRVVGSVRVRTVVSSTEVSACRWTDVYCDVTDEHGDPVEGAATTIYVTPEGGVTVDDEEVRFRDEGTYEVRCAMANGSGEDLYPPEVTVGPALPAEVIAILNPDSVTVGDPSTVSCEVRDACGDAMPELATWFQIDDGLQVDGDTVWADEPGDYGVTCQLEEPGKLPTDNPEAVLNVHYPDDPVRIELEAIPNRRIYTLSARVSLRATAYDAQDRVVEDADIVIEVPEGMGQTPDGRYRFLNEGSFLVRAYLADDPSIFDELVLNCDEGPPDIIIFSPERGSTFDGDGIVPVTGQVVDLGGVDWLRVNGVEVPLDSEGYFDTAVESGYGLNVVEFEARDIWGNDVWTTRGYYYSTGWVPMDTDDIELTRLLDSVLLFLGQEGLDDGDHDPANIDDIATVLEVLLNGFLDPDGLLDLIGITPGQSLFSFTFEDIINYSFEVVGIRMGLWGDLVVDITLEEVSLGDWLVSAQYRDGGIDMAIGIGGATPEDPGVGLTLGVRISLPLALGFESPIDGSIIGVYLDPPPNLFTTTAAYVHGILFELAVDADMPTGGDLDVAVTDIRVSLDGVDIRPIQDMVLDLGGMELPIIGYVDLPEVDLSNLVSGFSDLIGDAVLEPLVEWISDALGDLVSPFISDLVTTLVRQLVDYLELDLDLPIPPILGVTPAVDLHLNIVPSSVHMDADGGIFGLGASLTSQKGVDRDPLGSILRDECLGERPARIAFDTATPMQAAFLLDFVNEAIFSLWWGGMLNVDVDLSSLGGGLGGGLGGIDGQIALDFLLPPIMTDCTSDGAVDLQIGDLYLNLDGSLGGFGGGLEAWVSVSVAAQITADGDQLGMEIIGQPRLVLEIVSATGALALFADMIPNLINGFLPDIVDAISGALGAIPIPEIDLSAIVPGIPPGSVLRFGGLLSETVDGYVRIGGGLQ